MAVIRFGSFEVDLRAGELRQQGKKIRLQQQPFQTLALLLEHPGEVVTREELRRAIWPTNEFGSFDEGLAVAIYKLRTALGDSAEHPQFVETLPRRGYRFIAAIERLDASPLRTDRRRRRFVTVGVLTVTLLLVVSAGGVRNRLRGRAVAPRIRSIAVLPLRNLSGDTAQQYFADGMTESLITDLGNIAGLRVISLTSSMHYKGTHETLPAIGRELGVDAVVEGSVLSASHRVRVTAQLVATSPERHLWAETYERNMRDVLGLEDAIARAITNEVQSRVSASSQRVGTTTRARPVDPEAYNLYLRGRTEWDTWTQQGVQASIEYFERAIQRDSSFAPAWSGLSDAYVGLGGANVLPPELAWQKGKAAALRALQLDDSLSDAHFSLAMVLAHADWSWAAADTEFRRSIALNPNNTFAHEQHGDLLGAMGRFGEAIAEAQRALELDPLSPNKQNDLGEAFYRAGRYDEALQYFLRVPDPDFVSVNRHRRIAAIYERRDQPAEAMAEWLTALRLGGKRELAESVERVYRASDYATAKRTLLWGDVRELERRVQNGYPRPRSLDIAADYALLGERARAFAWIERSFREREWPIMNLRVDDRFESLRSDPRFQDLARRVGLPVSR